MAKCENCYHAEICKNYPNTGLPPKLRNELLDKGCEHHKDKSIIVELPCKVGLDKEISEDSKFIFDIIRQICNYAVKHNMRQYDTIKIVAENMLSLVEIAKFNGR